MNCKPRAFLCRRFTPAVEAELHRRYDLAVNQDDTILSPQRIAELADGAEVLFATATENINAELIQHLSPTLKSSATQETRDAMGWLLIQGLQALDRGEVPDNLLT